MIIRAFSDYHVHVRDSELLREVVPHTTACCGRFMVMPNLRPHIINAPQMMVYREMVRREIQHFSEVLMTVSLVEETTPEMIKACADEGCTAVKLYPEGVTTNSESGIRQQILLTLIKPELRRSQPLADRFWDNLGAIEDSGMVLCIHGELPGEEVLDREQAMLPLVEALLKHFKKIRVVLEHITTREAVEFISMLDYRYKGRIAATITPHHLMYTLTDLLGDKLQPHLFCKPVLKNDVDRNALRKAAISRRKCFFLGSDSAPWHRDQKHCDHGCAGVWNAPALVPTMFEIFDGMESLYLLEDFTSTFGDAFYGKKEVDRKLRVERATWMLPQDFSGIVPFRAGQIMRWEVRSAI